jgi:hypothetical protein
MKNLNFISLNKNLIICLISFITIYASSCKKDNKQPTPTQKDIPGPFVYVGGFKASGGVYWKISLSQPGSGVISDSIANSRSITSIVSSGNDVYIAAQTGGYWKNKSFVPVTGASSIEYVALSGNAVYTAGYDNSLDIAYWNNNTEVSLQNTIGKDLFPNQSVSEYGLTGITASASTAYVAGMLFTENQPFAPLNTQSGNFGLLWTNGGLKLFGKGFLASATYRSTIGIALLGNDVYIAGQIPDSTYAGGYWKNGAWNPLNNGLFIPNSISTSGNDLYITGYNNIRGNAANLIPGYWKNGLFISISGAAYTSAVVIKGNDVYVLGLDSNNNFVVWKNGALFVTIGSNIYTTATTMAIGS